MNTFGTKFTVVWIENHHFCLKVLAQLTNVEIERLNVMT